MKNLSMKKILFYLLVILCFLALSCDENNQSPTNIDQNNSGPAPYFLGDTSGYANRPTGFIVLRQLPTPIMQVQPKSPEYAKNNKISGRLYAHYCVSNIGTVRGVVVDSTENEIFNRSTLEAIIQWEFTPAIGVDSLPMEIWLFAPFHFVNN